MFSGLFYGKINIITSCTQNSEGETDPSFLQGVRLGSGKERIPLQRCSQASHWLSPPSLPLPFLLILKYERVTHQLQLNGILKAMEKGGTAATTLPPTPTPLPALGCRSSVAGCVRLEGPQVRSLAGSQLPGHPRLPSPAHPSPWSLGRLAASEDGR